MYKHIQDITLKDLQKKCTQIHYFGLGFIQVKLGLTYRIHFYTDILPPIIDEEDVHNHRYGFTSKILYGDFHQELFKVIPGNTHILQDESCKEGYISDPNTVKTCSLEKIGEQWFKEGSSYSISHQVFHRVSAHNAITLLTRSDYKKELAQVVRINGTPKICPFSKKISEEELWGIVERILKKI